MKTTQSLLPVEMPCTIAPYGDGLVREIGPDGLLIEFPGKHLPTGLLTFELQLTHSRVKFIAQGEVVGSLQVGGNTQVRVEFISTELVAA